MGGRIRRWEGGKEMGGRVRRWEEGLGDGNNKTERAEDESEYNHMVLGMERGYV